MVAASGRDRALEGVGAFKPRRKLITAPSISILSRPGRKAKLSAAAVELVSLNADFGLEIGSSGGDTGMQAGSVGLGDSHSVRPSP